MDLLALVRGPRSVGTQICKHIYYFVNRGLKFTSNSYVDDSSASYFQVRLADNCFSTLAMDQVRIRSWMISSVYRRHWTVIIRTILAYVVLCWISSIMDSSLKQTQSQGQIEL
jgi:hypothetical protein